jgi:hypothetical protein
MPRQRAEKAESTTEHELAEAIRRAQEQPGLADLWELTVSMRRPRHSYASSARRPSRRLWSTAHLADDRHSLLCRPGGRSAER